MLDQAPFAPPGLKLKQHRQDVDGLRALAVVPVVLFHIGLPQFSGGFVGVDIFFVISGFLITGLLMGDIERGRFSIANFYERRIRRIFPALMFCLAACLAVAPLLLLPAELASFGKSIMATLGFGSNFLFWREENYFDQAAEGKALLHTWSLAVEEQFYIFFPLLLFFLRKRRQQFQILILSAIAIGSFGVNVWGVYAAPTATFYLVHSRTWELLIGSLLALGAFPEFRRRAALEAEAAIGLGLVAAGWFVISPDDRFPGWIALLPTVGTVLLIHSGGAPQTTQVARALSNPVLVWIGLFSYSIYLWHWPIIVFTKQFLMSELDGKAQLSIALSSFALAAFSWKFVEQPFRNRRLCANRASLFAAAALATLVLGAAGAAYLVTGGWPGRLNAETLAIANIAAEKDEQIKNYKCVDVPLTKGGKVGLCRIGDPAAPAETLIWGDSHAMAWRRMFDGALKQAGSAGYIGSFPGCPPLFGFSRTQGDCLALTDKLHAYIETHPVKRIVLVGSWRGILASKNSTFEGVTSHDAQTRAENVRRALAKTIRDLQSRGIEVGFMEPPPGARRPVPETLARALWLGVTPHITYTANDYQEDFEPVISTARKLIPEAGLFAPATVVCGPAECPVGDAEGPYYFDANHPSHRLNQLYLSKAAGQLQGFLREPVIN